MTDVQEVRDAAQHAADTAVKTTEDFVKKNPIVSVAAMLSVGLLVGFAISKANKPPRRLERLQRMAGTDYRSRDLERVIDRLERAYTRSAPRAYEQAKDTVSAWPEMIASLAQVWGSKASAKIDEVRDAMPNVTDIKAAAANAARRVTK